MFRMPQEGILWTKVHATVHAPHAPFSGQLGSRKWRRSTYPFGYATWNMVMTTFQTSLMPRLLTTFEVSEVCKKGAQTAVQRDAPRTP